MAADAGTAAVRVTADTKALKTGMDQARKEVKTFGTAVSKMGLASKIGFAAAGAAALSFAKNAATSAIQFETTYRAFTNMVGSESELMLRRMQIASKGTVSELDLVKNANQAMLLGIDADALPEMMEIARAAARATGQDVGFMFQSIATGMGRQSRMILDNLGIIVNAEEAYKKYADSIGKVASQLTGAEMKIAFNTEAIAQGNVVLKKAGAEAETAADSVEQFSAAWADLSKEGGEIALPAINEGLKNATDNLKNLREEATLFNQLMKLIRGDQGGGFVPSFFGEEAPIFPGSPNAPGGGMSMAQSASGRVAQEAGKPHAEYAEAILESKRKLQELTAEVPKNNEEMNARIQAILIERDTLALLNKQAEESIPGLSKVIDIFTRMKLATEDLGDNDIRFGSKGQTSFTEFQAKRQEQIDAGLITTEGTF